MPKAIRKSGPSRGVVGATGLRVVGLALVVTDCAHVSSVGGVRHRVRSRESVVRGGQGLSVAVAVVGSAVVVVVGVTVAVVVIAVTKG